MKAIINAACLREYAASLGYVIPELAANMENRDLYEFDFHRWIPKYQDNIDVTNMAMVLDNGPHAKVVELMAGEGYDSQLLKKQFKKSLFVCIDSGSHFKKSASLLYLTADITKPRAYTSHADVVFIGERPSINNFLDFNQVIATFKTASLMLKKGGIFCCSMQAPTHVPGTAHFHYNIDYAVKVGRATTAKFFQSLYDIHSSNQQELSELVALYNDEGESVNAVHLVHRNALWSRNDLIRAADFSGLQLTNYKDVDFIPYGKYLTFKKM